MARVIAGVKLTVKPPFIKPVDGTCDVQLVAQPDVNWHIWFPHLNRCLVRSNHLGDFFGSSPHV